MDSLALELKIFIFAGLSWCVFWWTYGLIYYHKTRMYEVTTGDLGCLPILYWPPFSAMLPFLYLYVWYGGKDERFFDRIAKKIAGKLEERGIKVIEAEGRYTRGFGTYCHVVAEVKPEQIKDYQIIYAWAVKKFKNATQEIYASGLSHLSI